MLKDIIVHFTGSPEDRVRLDYAAAIASQFDAHLTGLLAGEVPEITASFDAGGTALIAALMRENSERLDAAAEALADQLERAAVSTQLRRIEGLARDVGARIAAEVRTADLFVGTRPYGDPNHGQHIEEAVLFQSGRPCLFVPPGGTPPARYDTILVAWKNTREAARAVGAAMPFLKAAKSVVIGMVEEAGASEQFGQSPGADIARHLARHGISTELRMINGWQHSDGALLNEAAQAGAEMVVMGAYGRSRISEWLLGGATRMMLSEAPIPVLATH
jgi:nucleotide-binding universal stress UspA family protein